MDRNLKISLSFLLLALISLAATAQTAPQQSVDQRADRILRRMTLEEKIDYIGGYQNFFIRGIPRLGAPELKMADGPMGVRNYGPSTAYPAGIALAASWDTALVYRVGSMMGKDSRARGVHFLLGPGMNIYRAPMNGRNFEYFVSDRTVRQKYAYDLPSLIKHPNTVRSRTRSGRQAGLRSFAKTKERSQTALLAASR